MEAGAATVERTRRPSRWVAGLLPLVVLGLAIALFTALGGPGLERRGVPVEELTVERTVLRPNEVELRVRNTGPDPVSVRQVIVNDAFTTFRQDDPRLDRLEGGSVRVTYPWREGEAYEVALLTSTGATIDHTIDAAAETPDADAGFFGLMGLIGLYVGIIPVAIGMLWLPWMRGADRRWIRFALALTVGLLAFLAIDATLEGVELAGTGAEGLGGPALVFLGAAAAYLLLSGVDAAMGARGKRIQAASAGGHGLRLALMVAIGIGLHNLGEGLAIGSAYAAGALALGASLVVGFALHNTTEGLAIVAPASGGGRIAPARLVSLGLVAGAPVILGAWIGAAAFHPAAAALLLGVGAGAIVQVGVQIAPSLRDRAGTLLNPLAVGGILAGLAIMYLTGLAISV